jgi:20S proteasome alpha/beta subunit
MTIALGIVASDGVVIAADRQETQVSKGIVSEDCISMET